MVKAELFGNPFRMTKSPSPELTQAQSTPFPPLAGIASYQDCTRPGHGVDKTVALLRRFLYIEGRLTKTLVAHLNAVPEWEAKCALSLHLWQDAEHCTWLRQRVIEMRNPPVRLDQVPSEGLRIFFEELLCSRTTAELLAGVYGVLKPALVAAMKEHAATANPMADYPTLRQLQFILLEEERQLQWGAAALKIIGDPPGLQAWKSHLLACLRAAGGVAGPDETAPSLPPRRYDGHFEPVRIPQRDARFTRVWNSRGRWLPDGTPPIERNVYQLYVRLTEMHVPELIALTMHDWKNQPWEFYHALARHLFDETRHAMMGEAAFETRGLDWKTVPHEVSFADFPNRNLSARDRYTLLWGIEHSMMGKNGGKRGEFEVAREAGDPLATTFQDFDWADEVLHVQIANKWLKPAFASDEEMNATYQSAREKIDAVIKADQDLPDRGWWEDFYRQAYGSPAPTSAPTATIPASG